MCSPAKRVTEDAHTHIHSSAYYSCPRRLSPDRAGAVSDPYTSLRNVVFVEIDHTFLNFVTQTLNEHLVLGRGGLYSQYFLSLQTALGLLPTGEVHHPSQNSYCFFLSRQDVTRDSQHVSKHASESVVNGIWIPSLSEKSICRVQNRTLIFQNIFPVELKNSRS